MIEGIGDTSRRDLDLATSMVAGTADDHVLESIGKVVGGVDDSIPTMLATFVAECGLTVAVASGLDAAGRARFAQVLRSAGRDTDAVAVDAEAGTD